MTFDFELSVLTGTALVDVLLGNAETDKEVHERRLSALEVAAHGAHYEVGIAPRSAHDEH